MAIAEPAGSNVLELPVRLEVWTSRGSSMLLPSDSLQLDTHSCSNFQRTRALDTFTLVCRDNGEGISVIKRIANTNKMTINEPYETQIFKSYINMHYLISNKWLFTNYVEQKDERLI